MAGSEKNRLAHEAQDTYPAIVLERRGQLLLACLQNEGAKKSRVILSSGHPLKVQNHRVYHKFDKQFKKSNLLDAEIKSWRDSHLKDAESWQIDVDLLWRSLEDDQLYTLSELCLLYFGTLSNEGLLSLVELFSARQADFQLVDSGAKRVDEETRSKIRERLQEEAQTTAENEGFLEWMQSANPHQQGLPVFQALLDGLKQFALCGADESSRRIRHLARKLDIGHADAALGWLCDKGFLDQDVNEIPSRQGFKSSWSPEAEAQSAGLLESILACDAEQRRLEPWKDHVDYTKRWTITIDQPSTKDVDDALSIWNEGEETLVAIHIADVCSYVDFDDALDMEARGRGSTVYLRDTTLGMFPDDFVERVVSLNVGVVRPALSLILRFAPGALKASEASFQRTLIKVDERLSYKQTRSLPWLEDERLQSLAKYARAHKQHRLDEGAVLSAQSELRVSFSSGEPQIKRIKHDSLGHEIVSELMVLYNYHGAKVLKEKRASALFKIQPVPIRDANRLTPAQLAGPLARLQQRFPPAKISCSPAPHRTLGLGCYVQMTAPIRRYTDLLAQR
ncbi:MAG: ribonuclease catalytic domain-containing protein, partial [Planctomycetota bacterium]|nr:ribonuclease catalytic domain-containing protein [Planctomycetota bacterium]